MCHFRHCFWLFSRLSSVFTLPNSLGCCNNKLCLSRIYLLCWLKSSNHISLRTRLSCISFLCYFWLNFFFIILCKFLIFLIRVISCLSLFFLIFLFFFIFILNYGCCLFFSILILIIFSLRFLLLFGLLFRINLW